MQIGQWILDSHIGTKIFYGFLAVNNFDFPRKIRENVEFLHCLAIDNFDFPRKIVNLEFKLLFGNCPIVIIQEWNEKKNSCNRRVNHYATNFYSTYDYETTFLTTKICLPKRTGKGKRSEWFRFLVA